MTQPAPTPLPAFSDNYIWIIPTGSDSVLVVDPGEAAPVQQYLEKHNLGLDAILITHHHFDHVGGVEMLKEQFNCPVHGPENPALGFVDHRYGQGDALTIGPFDFAVLEVPGHTLDHIAFFCDGEAPFVLCGDTLFAGGCGRVFEGDAQMMHDSLRKLAALPASTLVCCAHEYTLANLAFARAVDPDNRALEEREQRDRLTRDAQRPTVPTTLALELETNPFLRCAQESIRRGLANAGKPQGTTEAETFQHLRHWKDNF